MPLPLRPDSAAVEANMKKKSYRKYTYWVKQQDVEEVQAFFRSRDRRLKWARGVVCTALDPISKVMLVPPKAWEETCDRQGSWYRGSPRAGQYLLVSEEVLDHPAMEANTIITPSSFEPPAQAMDGDVERLLCFRNLPQAGAGRVARHG